MNSDSFQFCDLAWQECPFSWAEILQCCKCPLIQLISNKAVQPFALIASMYFNFFSRPNRKLKFHFGKVINVELLRKYTSILKKVFGPRCEKWQQLSKITLLQHRRPKLCNAPNRQSTGSCHKNQGYRMLPRNCKRKRCSLRKECKGEASCCSTRTFLRGKLEILVPRTKLCLPPALPLQS